MLLLSSITQSNASQARAESHITELVPIMTVWQYFQKHGVASRLEQQSSLIAVNAVAADPSPFSVRSCNGVVVGYTDWLLPGYDQGVMGGVNTARHYASLMGFGHYDETDGLVKVDSPLLQDGIVAVYYLPGTLVGALWGGWLGDRYGRITTIGIAAVWAVTGTILPCSAQNANWMFCARVFNGIGTGILNPITPVWATETASHTSRGAFVAIEFTLNIFGVVWYFVLWRLDFKLHLEIPIAFQIVPLIGLLIVVWFTPESPRWLVKVGCNEEARFILGRLRGEHNGIAEAEYHDIKNIVKLEEDNLQSTSYFTMLFGIKQGKLHTARRVQLVVWLQILQEWIDIAGITIYGPEIFVKNIDCYDLSCKASRTDTPQTIAGIAAKDRQWVSGLNNITYMVFPLQVRAKGNAWGVVGWSIGNGWCVLLLPTIFAALGEKSLYILGGVSVLAIIVVWALYPETNQCTLEEMNLVFASDSIWE
ncbi:hypothetical protein LTR56_023580 [Elasticomyces elasticus]|nr:hypothetical protein LTR56_023580 [Elasticomyces elasticus]KAK3624105.1 hypothetical protein LTR22_024120 [Elasticomyces elasticus]KAK4908639.1 hypothetical protein LTR49_022503 [Elasticomyces elasticus]KAK5729585.1 hypothetical protein LTS12_027325 [Elasticomyces elasticus]